MKLEGQFKEDMSKENARKILEWLFQLVAILLFLYVIYKVFI